MIILIIIANDYYYYIGVEYLCYDKELESSIFARLVNNNPAQDVITCDIEWDTMLETLLFLVFTCKLTD